MLNKKAILLSGVLILCIYFLSGAQGFAKDPFNEGLTYSLNEKGDRYIRLTFLGQFWARYNQNNPGTVFYDEPKNEQLDFSFRRVRMQLMVQPHERWFIYSQFGLNNFNYVTARKPSFFLHDFSIDYMAVKNHLYIGAGLHSWAASSRYAAPGVASILGVDAPLYQQQLNDETDQFVRNLGIFFKGSANRLNFRLAFIKPFAYAKSANFNPTEPIADYSLFSPRDPAFETGTYLEWQFFDKESDKLPYKSATYLGKKKMLNLGMGARYRPKATWYKTASGDTAFSPLILATVDLFMEIPFVKGKQTAINVYTAYTYSNFGPGYLRQVAVNSIATGSTLPSSNLNGPGDAIPLVGTGHSLFAQAGIITPKLPKTELRFMPYASVLVADFGVTGRPISLYQGGMNLFIKGQNIKFTAGWENRPFFKTATNRALRKNMVVLQFQFFI